MSRRAAAITLLLAGLLIVSVGALYVYDRGRDDEIARGVRVNGIDVSGLSPQQAREKLRATLLEPLSRPVSVRAGGRRFTLTAERASIGVDIDGSVDRALARSREGNLFTRSWRALRGEELDADVDARITWSRPAVRRVVHRVVDRVSREPVDAHIDLEHGDVTPRRSRDGVRVRAARLRRDIERELLDMSERRLVRARLVTLKPKVTTAELAEKYPTVIVVSRGSFQLTLYKDLELAKTYPIAVGQAGLETPAGLYNIENKAVDPAWHVPNSDWAGDLAGQVIPGGVPENPLKARWMGIYAGAGIHGTDAISSLGTAASHGCIRMAIPDVIELYDQVDVGAPVYIS
jgi:lipoprotein-anchoring transpeptidase ErfK/SrfK